jgi:hypothetical protein
MHAEELESLKRSIIASTFVDILVGELRVDQSAFDALCTALQELAKVWHVRSAADKEMVQHLCTLPDIATSTSLVMKFHTGIDSSDLDAMIPELERLVQNCLAPASTAGRLAY